MNRSPLPPRKKPIKRSNVKRSASKPLISTPDARTADGSKPLIVTPPPKARAKIKKKLPKDNADVVKFRKAVIAASGGHCQVCPILIASGDPDSVAMARGCEGAAAEAHHMEPRGMGGHGNNDPSNGIGACGKAHRYIEAHRTIAKSLGLIRSHGKPSKSIIAHTKP